MGSRMKKGTSKERHTKTEKLKALIYLENSGFNHTETAKKYNISISTIRRWSIEMGYEAFGIKPRIDIALNKKNQLELLEISKLHVQTLKANISAIAAHLILERLNDEEKLASISTDTLVRIAALYKEEVKPVDAPKEIDILRQRMEQLYQKRPAAKDAAKDSSYLANCN